MAPMIPALTTKVTTGSPYQLDPSQTLKASTALLKQIRAELERTRSSTDTKNLLATNDDTDGSGGEENVPVWQIFTLKKHPVDKNKLQPKRIPLPHSLYTSPSTLSICLITSDPQREIKDTIKHPSFPAELRTQLVRVIGYSKLKARYKSFESKRQLLSEHDIFMADDRIASRLPETLGKTFYKSSKKPCTVSLAVPQKVDGQKVKKDKRKNPDQHWDVKPPLAFAGEVERAVTSAMVYLNSSTNVAIKVGNSSFTPEQLAENIKAVTSGMTDKPIVKGWRNIKAIHVKGPKTVTLPIWLADELWEDEKDVLEDRGELVIRGAGKNKKRKAKDEGEEEEEKEEGISKKSKKAKVAEDDAAKKASRKAKLLKQKSNAVDDLDEYAELMQRVKADRAGGSKDKAGVKVVAS